MEFRICFAMAKYENDMFLLCETSNAFIGAFCYSKIHFLPSGPFKSIKVKKYKKTSRATSALDTSVVLECLLI